MNIQNRKETKENETKWPINNIIIISFKLVSHSQMSIVSKIENKKRNRNDATTKDNWCHFKKSGIQYSIPISEDGNTYNFLLFTCQSFSLSLSLVIFFDFILFLFGFSKWILDLKFTFHTQQSTQIASCCHIYLFSCFTFCPLFEFILQRRSKKKHLLKPWCLVLGGQWTIDFYGTYFF